MLFWIESQQFALQKTRAPGSSQKETKPSICLQIMKRAILYERLLAGFLLLITECTTTGDFTPESLARWPDRSVREGLSREVIAESDPRIEESCSQRNSYSMFHPAPVQMKVARPQKRIKLLGVFMEPDVPPQPQPRMKLMGSFMEPQAQPEQTMESIGASMVSNGPLTPINNHEVTKPSVQSNPATSLEGSTEIETTLNRDSPPPPGSKTYNSETVPPSEPAPIVVQDVLNSNDQPTREKEFQADFNSIELNFDYDLFEHSPSLIRNEASQAKILQVFENLGIKKLQMTVEDFVENQRDFQEMDQEPLPSTYTATERKSALNLRRNDKLRIALGHFSRDPEIWYNHWAQQAGFDSTSCARKIDSLPDDRVKQVARLYLFYVEMISTIVPSQKEGESVGSHLSKAVQLLKDVMNSVSTRKTRFERHVKMRKQAEGRGPAHSLSAVWTLVEWWLKTSRNEIFEQLEKQHKPFRNTKMFFNFIFRHSIETLVQRLESSSRMIKNS
jgi:hypothetical protein